MTGLMTGSQSGTGSVALLPLAAVAPVTAASTAATCALTSRRSP
ncbi:hypothetical protein [Streptomyces sp. MBT53]|nr:hypothetical protein [Streptomyces sp. MBT53]